MCEKLRVESRLNKKRTFFILTKHVYVYLKQIKKKRKGKRNELKNRYG